MSHGRVPPEPESTLAPELLEPEPTDVPLEPELPLEPVLLEAPLEPDPLLEPDVVPEPVVAAGSELASGPVGDPPPDPEDGPLLALDASASRDEPESLPPDPHALTIAIAKAE
jgi:hypothetical protein